LGQGEGARQRRPRPTQFLLHRVRKTVKA
jgi:hypothetical protein